MADTTNIKFRKIISFNSFTLLYGTFSYIFSYIFHCGLFDSFCIRKQLCNIPNSVKRKIAWPVRLSA